MSESSANPASSSDGPSGPDDDQLVPDEKLPEDLQPEKNPLARDPDDDPDAPGGVPRPGGGTDGPPAGGMPDMGQPG
jgi:hypothetical protein